MRLWNRANLLSRTTNRWVRTSGSNIRDGPFNFTFSLTPKALLKRIAVSTNEEANVKVKPCRCRPGARDGYGTAGSNGRCAASHAVDCDWAPAVGRPSGPFKTFDRSLLGFSATSLCAKRSSVVRGHRLRGILSRGRAGQRRAPGTTAVEPCCAGGGLLGLTVGEPRRACGLIGQSASSHARSHQNAWRSSS